MSIIPKIIPDRETQHLQIDDLERLMLAQPENLLIPGYVHRFVPHLYLREIIMPPGMIHTTKVHDSEHAFVVLSGEVMIASPGAEPTIIKAPYVGVTYPGTRRVLYNPVECRWMTLHPLTTDEENARRAGATDEELIAMVEQRIIRRRELDDGKTSHELGMEAIEARRLKGGPE